MKGNVDEVALRPDNLHSLQPSPGNEADHNSCAERKTGQPISGQRVLVFLGSTKEKVLFHEGSNVELRTDEMGNTKLSLNSSRAMWIMPLVDWKTLCEADKKKKVFDISPIEVSGLSSENGCGSHTPAPQPGILTIFAREPTFRERMAW